VKSPTNPNLLRYRPWRGTYLGPWNGMRAIARVCLSLIFRRKLFWALYGLSMLIFLFYFFGQYLQVFLEQKLGEENLRLGGVFTRNLKPETLMKRLRNAMQLNGSSDTYGNFLWFEGYIVVIILAFAGSVLIGNDFHYGSLPFYLSKPISRWHYVLGKCLAIGVLINMMTTAPCLLLFIEYGFIDNRENFDYFFDESRLLLGILGYGAVLTVTLSLVLMATATWLRKTIPMVMIWITIFILGRMLQRWLVDGLGMNPGWRLMDLWNNMYLTGMWIMGKDHAELLPSTQLQPAYENAALAVAVICIVCVLYLHRRIRAVEIVS